MCATMPLLDRDFDKRLLGNKLLWFNVYFTPHASFIFIEYMMKTLVLKGFTRPFVNALK